MALTVLIPALNPSDNMVGLVGALAASDKVDAVIIVNDGSSPGCDGIFQEASRHPKVTLLRHPVNLGKGAALRTGMNQYLSHGDTQTVLVTADADGQHLPEDILRVGEKGGAYPEDLVLGVRSFAQGVPLRSRFGNTLTHVVFRLVVGKNVQDTQTGLRAIPRSLMPTLMKVKASGYEFELEMLIKAVRVQMPLTQVPIKTVYHDGNKSSHFRPVVDSIRIYFVFVRYLATCGLAALTGRALFSVACLIALASF